jgi:hypothetical protein
MSWSERGSYGTEHEPVELSASDHDFRALATAGFSLSAKRDG